MNKYSLVIFALFHLSSQQQQFEDASFWDKIASKELEESLKVSSNLGLARNVILFVGDGMGPNTITAARIYKGQRDGQGPASETGHLIFEKFPHLGLLKTYNVDKQVSDSASTATALFCGVKTNQKTLGVDANVKLGDCEASLNSSFHLKSIIQWAQSSGKRTGFITNTRVTHATPAALYAHSAHRSWECEAKMPPSASACKDIARQLIENEPGKSLNVIMGGGRQCLVSNVAETPIDPRDTWACYRKDGLDLIKTWMEQKKNEGSDYKYVSSNKELMEANLEEVDFVLGIFANGFLKYEYERDATISPSLAEMTTAAIKVLDKGQNGFLLVVESGMIDLAHHRGTAKRALDETASLDAAVEEALKHVDINNTLVVVTADHAHTLSISGYPARGANILGIASKSKKDSLNYTTLTYATGTEIKYFALNETHITRTDPSNEDLDSFTYQQQSTILTDEVLHGGGDVTVYAKGPWSHLFHSLHEQNFVAHVIGHAAKIGPYKSNASGLGSKFCIQILMCIFVIKING